MKPYWVLFERRSAPTFLNLGVGVTAISEDDARRMVALAFPEGRVASLTVIQDVAILDQGHVLPNMGNILIRGVWFPVGFEQIAGQSAYR